MWLQHIVVSLKYPISFLYWTDLVAVQFVSNVPVETDKQIDLGKSVLRGSGQWRF